MTYRKRAFTALVACALALPLLASPVLAAPGDTPIPPAQDITTVCTNAFQAQFDDVAPSGDSNANELAMAVNCLASALTRDNGNTDTDVIARGNPGTPTQPQGIGARLYGPQLNVTRGQMASFIARLIDASSVRERTAGSIRELPAPAAANPFPGDVPNNYVHLDNIRRLFQAGIVNGNPGTQQQPNGIGPDRYGPDLFVTRSQMASFINRAVAYATGGDPRQAGTAGNGFAAPNAEYYVDAQQAIHARNVNGITSVGISQGIGAKRYDGLGNVTRQQMARFIARTLGDLYDQDRIFSLLETFTNNFDAASRGDQNVAANGTRLLTVNGLNPNTDYRITLVKCENVDRNASDRVFFTRDGEFANTGMPSSRIVGTGDGGSGGPITPAPSTAFKPGAGGTFTITITNTSGQAECVVAVVYLDGAPGESLSQGGNSPRLEVDANGFPREFFGISGQTRFAATPAPQPTPLTITDARVATDAAVATPGGTATGTASSGDVFTLTFSENIATDSAMATGQAITVSDPDGDTARFVCGLAAGAPTSSTDTAVQCTIQGNVLTVRLLEDARDTNTGTGNGELTYDLTITGITGFTSADGTKTATPTGDTLINRDANTQFP